MNKLMDTLRILVYEIFLEIFYQKLKWQPTFLINFYISNNSHSSIKRFLK